MPNQEEQQGLESVESVRFLNMLPKTSIYTPIIEAIMNSIQSIHDKKENDGEVIVEILRDKKPRQYDLLSSEKTEPDIVGFKIIDNWIWFTEENLDSWKTILSKYKANIWGKWLWRFSYLQHFNTISIDSYYKWADGEVHHISFWLDPLSLTKDKNIEVVDKKKLTGTVLLLEDWNDNFVKWINSKSKKLETFSRKILEKMLINFIREDMNCPKIVIKDGGEVPVILNKLIKKNTEIIQEYEKDFSIKINEEQEELFNLKIFKVFYSTERNSIFLCANNIIVTEQWLGSYIKDLWEKIKDFVDAEKNNSNNISLKVYVTSKYLDDHVNYQRQAFDFSKWVDIELFSDQKIIDDKTIENKAMELIKEHFDSYLKKLRDDKLNKIQDFVKNEAPYYDEFLKEIDPDFFSQWFSTNELEKKFREIEVMKRNEVFDLSKQIKLENWNKEDIDKKIDELMGKYTQIQKTELARYVSMRKIVINLLKSYLEQDEEKKYKNEDTIHKLIFPMKSDSQETIYKEHNLWLLDERLSFAEYISSDNSIDKDDKKGQRWDIIFFNKPIAVRGWDDLSNPITVFEFKKPQRKGYDYEDEDPIEQICLYIEKIREGSMNNYKGRPINANGTTPWYGFLLCDMTNKIHYFAKRHQLKLSSDWLWYFWYHETYKVYLEIISFDKVVKDTEKRNQILFHKLWI